MSSTLRRFTQFASRRSGPLFIRTIASSNHWLASVPAAAANGAFDKTVLNKMAANLDRDLRNVSDKFDIDDESDIIEVAKEEELEIKRDIVFSAGAHRRNEEIEFDIEDESDIIELAKEEIEDIAKGKDMKRLAAEKKRMRYGKIQFDLEDESDLIEQAKATECQESKQALSSVVKSDDNTIEFDIEDESDIIELAKDEKREAEKHLA